MTALLRHPRWANRLYAAAVGYFWLPCPICGQMFGGHEYGSASVPTGRVGEAHLACWRHRSVAEVLDTHRRRFEFRRRLVRLYVASFTGLAVGFLIRWAF